MKGSRPTQKYVLNKSQKIHAFGAMGDSEVMIKSASTINSKKFLAFIRRLSRKHEKLCLIIDNARWHLTKKILAFVRKRKITLIRLPPYSPELNPIEQFWKNAKQLLATKQLFDKEQLVREVKRALRKKSIIPKSSYY